MSTTMEPENQAGAAAKNGRSATGKKRKKNRKFPSNGALPQDENWPQWVSLLRRRTSPRSLDELLPAAKKSPLRWGISEQLVGSDGRRLLKRLHRAAHSKRSDAAELATLLEEWLSSAAQRKPDAQLALECLAWCHALPWLAEVLPAAPWCELFEFLTTAVESSAALSLERQPLVRQLLAGELPLTLAYLFPELDHCRSLAKPARQELSQALVELTDGEGLTHADNFPVLRALLACWTRCLSMGRTMKKPCFDKSAQDQLAWLVRQALRLTRYDGAAVFAPLGENDHGLEAIQAALELCGDNNDETIAGLVLRSQKAVSRRALAKLPSAAIESEWSEAAVLRPNWSVEGPSLVVAYPGGAIKTELNVGRDTIWSGDWNPQFRFAGAEVRLASAWEQVCWHSDHDVDYLELEASLDNDWRIQRQFLLARHEQFAYVADAVLGDEPAEVEYRSVLPLCESIRFKPAEDTWEGQLQGRKRIANIFPLAFPEWRSERFDGALAPAENGLELAIARRGTALYAPLFIDFNQRRIRKPYTWRQLTVAHRLQSESADQAVGYRVAAGKEQWIVYRSLGEKRDRTLLGQHRFCEFLTARFSRNGEAEDLIEIE